MRVSFDAAKIVKKFYMCKFIFILYKKMGKNGSETAFIVSFCHLLIP